MKLKIIIILILIILLSNLLVSAKLNQHLSRSNSKPIIFKINKIRYYFRGYAPTHGQPVTEDGSRDCKAMLLDPPTQKEEGWCLHWVQASPDEVPDDLPKKSLLIKIDVHWYYELGDPFDPDNWRMFIGLEREADYEYSFRKDVDPWRRRFCVSKSYNLAETTYFPFWIMENSEDPEKNSWYWIEINLWANQREPHVVTDPVNLSYADFYYIPLPN
jgi:hypothetical protein